MILSRTSEYALQALTYLAAQPPGSSVLNRDVARYLGVPAPYLTKILKDLVKHGLAVSQKGRGGGYAIHPAALRTSIRTVVELTEGRDVFEGCLLGLKVCSDATACPVHHRWSPMKAGLLALLGKQTIGAMAEAVRAGRYRVAANRVPPASRRRSRP
jgi:Rrf2 family protein